MTIQNPHMLPKIRSKALMSGAKGQPCSFRIASYLGIPCASVETTVAHHLPVFGKGVGTKTSDMFTGFICQTCHDILHSRTGTELHQRYPSSFMERHLLALCETQARHLMEGRIVVPDAEWI